MSKRRSNKFISTAPKPRSSSFITDSPASSLAPLPVDKPPSSGSLSFFIVGICLVAVIGLVAIRWSNASDDQDKTPGKEKHPKAPSAWRAETEDDRVCDRFVAQSRASNPEAVKLLGRDPAPCAGEISESEAEQWQTDYFLRDPNLLVRSVRRGPMNESVQQYVFATRGNVSAPRLAIRLKNGESTTEQRTMSNPDLFVEVRDGKICGVRATLHHD